MKLEEQIIEIRIEEVHRKFVINLLQETKFPIEKIAQLAGVSFSIVEEIRNELYKK